MRGNPDGSLSSAGRFATGLLSFRYTVRTLSKLSLEAASGRPEEQVAAGMNPAAKATKLLPHGGG